MRVDGRGLLAQLLRAWRCPALLALLATAGVARAPLPVLARVGPAEATVGSLPLPRAQATLAHLAPAPTRAIIPRLL